MASTSRGYTVEELRALVEYMMGELHRLSGGDSGPSQQSEGFMGVCRSGLESIHSSVMALT